VLLKGLLGEAVEGERGDGAMEMRSGATPSGEVISFCPDQAFVTHTSTFLYRGSEIELGAAGAEHITASSVEGELLPAGEYFARIRHRAM